MKNRTLVARRRYFGVEAVSLQHSAYRILARVVGMPQERARISNTELRHDFGVDTRVGATLVTKLVAGGLVRPHPGPDGDLEVLPRMAEFAAARVVEPLLRSKARRLVERAGKLAEKFNHDATRNPLSIVAVATCGEYVLDCEELSELRFGIVVCDRPPNRMSRWRAHIPADEANAEVRRMFTELSSFVQVVMTEDTRALPRPFSIAWQDQAY
jgi:hypothetical protein